MKTIGVLRKSVLLESRHKDAMPVVPCSLGPTLSQLSLPEPYQKVS